MSTVVIGVGHPDRGDDALGPVVIDALRATAPDDVELRVARGDMLALFDAWAGAELAVLVDAMQSGEPPGTLRRIDAGHDDAAAALGSCASTHAFDLGQAIELARTLGRLPGRLVVYGVEAGPLAHGAPLSEPVERAVPAVVRAVLEEVTCTKRR